jgi:hypothetical protein
MNWRTTQLGSSLCNQDQLILNLFRDKKVQYIGSDLEFPKNLQQDSQSENLILIINSPLWVSELLDICKKYLIDSIDTFYIGINRYVIKGNDTCTEFYNSSQFGSDIINFVSRQLQQQGFIVTKSGSFDQDLGRYFNFVQPLTWVYGNKNSNHSN